MGPIDYLVVEFPGSRMTGEGLPLLVDLVDRGIIRILDLLFVKKEMDGSVAGVAIADLDKDGTLDLAVFEGASSGMLGQDDIDEAGGVLEPGSSAGMARTAVVAGTATAVSNRVSRRQADRWSQQEQQQAYEAPPPPPADDMDTKLDQLRQLGELKTQGVLSEAEFEAQKARILGS